MERSSYHIAGMDCEAEAALVRLELEGLPSVRGFTVDPATRRLEVVHEGGRQAISRALERLSLGARRLSSVPVDAASDAAGSQPAGKHAATQASLLRTVLAINAGFFVLEATFGVLGRSLGLLGDSLDMLADAFVYALALLAVGGSGRRKRSVARASGLLQLALAALGLSEVVRRAFSPTVPDDLVMMLVAMLALAGNAVTLTLLRRERSGEAHVRASVIFTSNDVLVNLGVIVAGALVALTGSGVPDLAIGAAVFLVVGRGAVRILRLAG